MASFRQLQLEVWQRRITEQRAEIAALEENLRLASGDEADDLRDELKKARRVLEWSEEEIRRLTRF